VVSGKPCAVGRLVMAKTSLSEFHCLTLHSLQGLLVLDPAPCGAVTITQSPAIPLTHVTPRQRVKNGWIILINIDDHESTREDSWTAASIDP
jgi:hypothetical protein